MNRDLIQGKQKEDGSTNMEGWGAVLMPRTFWMKKLLYLFYFYIQEQPSPQSVHIIFNGMTFMKIDGLVLVDLF